MDNKDSITEINMYGDTVIYCTPGQWSPILTEIFTLIDNAVMIVKNWNNVPISTVNFKKNLKYNS